MVAAAVCPHPPMLVPEVAAGAADELDDLRAACADVVGRLVDSGARSLIVIGAGPSVSAWPSPVTVSFAGYGVPTTVSLGERAPGEPLSVEPVPLSLAVGAWLLRDATGIDVSLYSLPDDLSPARCADWTPAGFDLEQPWALLAMGDGSACLTAKAPGYFDPDAAPFDESVAAALAGADTAALLAIEADQARRLWCAGRPAWQALAGRIVADGRGWTGDLRYHEAPYGVGYLVAEFSPAGGGTRRTSGAGGS